MNPDYVVVDANIAFKTLVANRGDLRDRLGPGANAVFCGPRYLSTTFRWPHPHPAR